MASKPTTFRIDPPAQAALEHLSRVLKRPMNQLVNEAVKDYVNRRSREVERDLEGTIAKLRAYRQRDPHLDVERSVAELQHARTVADELGRPRYYDGLRWT